jgi:hypothetical protein
MRWTARSWHDFDLPEEAFQQRALRQAAPINDARARASR